MRCTRGLVCRPADLSARGAAHTGTFHYCRFSSKPKGRRFFKPCRIYATGPQGQASWTNSLELKCNCGAKGKPPVHVLLMKKELDGRWSGTKELRGSQTYTPRLGRAIVSAWQKAGAAGLDVAAAVAALPQRRLQRGPEQPAAASLQQQSPRRRRRRMRRRPPIMASSWQHRSGDDAPATTAAGAQGTGAAPAPQGGRWATRAAASGGQDAGQKRPRGAAAANLSWQLRGGGPSLRSPPAKAAAASGAGLPNWQTRP